MSTYTHEPQDNDPGAFVISASQNPTSQHTTTEETSMETITNPMSAMLAHVRANKAADPYVVAIDVLFGEESKGLDIRIPVPVGFLDDIKEFVIPAVVREVEHDDDGNIIMNDIQRAALRLAASYVDFVAHPNHDTLAYAKEAGAVYQRNSDRYFAWAANDLVNMRDNGSVSSAYLIGVPAWNHNFVDKLCNLMPYEIALHPKVARKLGVEDGARALLSRFPVVKALPVIVRYDDTIGESVIGLSVGEIEYKNDADEWITTTVPTILGGDCDGDHYVIKVFHTDDCKAEIDRVFTETWNLNWKPVNTPGTLFTGYDEVRKGQADEEIFAAKKRQKLTMPVVTLDFYAMSQVKLMAEARGAEMPISFKQIRYAGERSLEVSMDAKKAETVTLTVHGKEVRLLKDDLLLHKLLNGERGFDEETVRLELIDQGYDPNVVRDMVGFVEQFGGDVRKIAAKNPAYNLLQSTNPKTVQAFLETAPKEDIARYILDCLMAKRMLKVGEWPNRETVRRPKKTFGQRFLSANYDATTQTVEVKCGLGSAVIPTFEDGKAIRISEMEVALFRPTVEVQFEVAADDVTCKPMMHYGWPSVICAVVNSHYAWNVREITGERSIESASRELVRLLKKVLRRMFKTYEMEDADIKSWAAVAGAHKYVMLDTELPTIKGYDFVALEEMRRQCVADTLKDKGRIARMCDTISGNPGTAFYAKTKSGRTFATETDPMDIEAAIKRAPVRNAISNLVELVNQTPESFRRENVEFLPPMVELVTVAWRIHSMDAILISRSAAKKLQAKVGRSIKGLDFGSYEYYDIEDGSKIQGRIDAKGVVRVVPDECMPFAEYANGTRVRAEVVFGMESQSHEMLRHTHATLALTAMAYRDAVEHGYQTLVPNGVTFERIAKRAVRSGLYEDEQMLVKLIHPETGAVIEMVPGGMAAFGVHRQFPQLIAAVHGAKEVQTAFFPTSNKDGGVVSGLASLYSMKAAGLDVCIEQIYSQVSPVLERKLQALAGCIVRHPESGPAANWPRMSVFLPEKVNDAFASQDDADYSGAMNP
jgi:hypothetical protein